MKQIFLFFWMAFVCLKLYAQQSSANTSLQTNSTNVYAVVVGISSYQDSTIDQLQYADADAIAFANFLKSKTGGSVPEQNIRLLTNSQATQAAVILAVNWLAKVCKKDDVVFFYFSGHGDVENITMFNNAYLICYNTLKEVFEGMSLSVDKLNDIAKTLSSRTLANVVLITDACHSGKIANNRATRNQLVGEQLLASTEKEIRIASCKPEELSNENADWGGGRGIFSYYLVNGLQGYADEDKNGIITLGEIKNYLASQMKNDPVLQQENRIQTPVIKDNNDGFKLAHIDKEEFEKFKAKTEENPTPPLVISNNSPATQNQEENINEEPDDYFFSLLKKHSLEELTDSLHLISLSETQIPFAVIDKLKLSLNSQTGINKLNDLKKMLEANTEALQHFNESLVRAFDDRAHEVITQYLRGDEAELERRRYYNANNNGYDVYPRMFKVALKLIKPDNFYYDILQFKLHYFTGVNIRLKVPTVQDASPLIEQAIQEQKQALELDKNAAQVYNELGILYMFNGKYKDAEKYFKEAIIRNHNWSFPWANLAGLYALAGRVIDGYQANHIADSLQKGLQLNAINLGMLDEKSSNILFAEEDYRNAIDINSRHFLPFERLGYINLHKTAYAVADSFFYEASLRKKGYHFKGNVWMSVAPIIVMPPVLPLECDIDTSKINAGDLMAFFYWGVKEYETKHYSNALRILKKVIALDQFNPLVFHYIGKIYYDQQKWKEAEIMFKYAVDYYLDTAQFNHYCDSVIQSKSYSYAHDCFEKFFTQNYYQQVEDFYFLADLYQLWNHPDEAELLYKKIIQQFPLQLPAYIKLWQHLEKQERYIQAENTIQSYSVYDAETSYRELNAFYRRLLNKFPDNGEWNYKLGMLLYSRANLPSNYAYFDSIVWFPRMNKEVFIDFDVYQQFLSNMNYQFDISTKSNNSILYKNEIKETPKYLLVPGVGESIQLAEPVYLPRYDGIKYLKKASEILAERKLLAEVNYKIGNIYFWSGSSRMAFPFYEKSIGFDSANANTRFLLINAGLSIFKNRAVLSQLNYLYNNSQINFPMQLKLAELSMYAGQFQNAEKILSDAITIHPYHLPEFTVLQGRLNLLAGNYKKAIAFYMLERKNNPNDAVIYYTIARLFAAQGQKKEAFNMLEESIAKGFNYLFVINADPMLAELHKSSNWQALIKKIQPKEWKKISGSIQ